MRRILHVDMDAFYASVEQRDHPEWRGQPLLVGGRGRRSVVCAASYEARRFGAFSAMPMARALQLCPQARVVPPRFERYQEVSRQITEIFSRYSQQLEPIALDESFLDVSEYCQAQNCKAGEVARWIRQSIRQELSLTASAGVAPNKLVAKIASGFRKPDGLTIVPPEQVRHFLAPLAIRELWGVGPVTEQRFHQLGIRTIGDLADFDPGHLAVDLGHWAPYWQRLARGEDDRPVENSRPCKSISVERTFEEDLPAGPGVLEVLRYQAIQLHQRLLEAGFQGRTLVLKLRFADFTTISRHASAPQGVGYFESEPILERAWRLFREQGTLPQLRLIGLGVANLLPLQGPRQLVFPFEEAGSASPSAKGEA